MRQGMITIGVAAVLTLTGCGTSAPAASPAAPPQGTPVTSDTVKDPAAFMCEQLVSSFLNGLLLSYLDPAGGDGFTKLALDMADQYGAGSVFFRTAMALREDEQAKTDARSAIGVQAAVAAAQPKIAAGCATATFDRVP